MPGYIFLFMIRVAKVNALPAHAFGRLQSALMLILMKGQVKVK